MMALVDTSVWIEFFREGGFPLDAWVDFDEVVTCPPVIQEVLQGFREERAFRTAKEAMLALPIVESPMGLEVYEHAAHLYRTVRGAGFTIRSGVDCLIAACAIRNGLDILHCDRDFDALARVGHFRSRNVRAS